LVEGIESDALGLKLQASESALAKALNIASIAW
jgi:hypothetical protein